MVSETPLREVGGWAIVLKQRREKPQVELEWVRTRTVQGVPVMN